MGFVTRLISLESNVSVGDTCKEIGALRHGSDNAAEDPDA
jgi:hypothetical protein